MTTTTEAKVRELLNVAGYDGQECLVDFDSGELASAEVWANDVVTDDIWTNGNDDAGRKAVIEGFFALREFKKDADGKWVEV